MSHHPDLDPFQAGGLRMAALVVRFLCELGMLAALAVWGYRTGEGAWSAVLAVLVPGVAAVTWGLFVAPKAKRPVSTGVRLGIEFVLFGAAVAALLDLGYPILALVLGAAAAATSIVLAMPRSSSGTR